MILFWVPLQRNVWYLWSATFWTILDNTLHLICFAFEGHALVFTQGLVSVAKIESKHLIPFFSFTPPRQVGVSSPNPRSGQP